MAPEDVWDNDFASGISPNALNLPHLKPQDHFNGNLSSDRLKAFATQDTPLEEQDNWDSNYEGELTVKSPLHMTNADPLETVRPYFPPKANIEDIRQGPPTRSPERNFGQARRKTVSSSPKLQKKVQKASQPAAANRGRSGTYTTAATASPTALKRNSETPKASDSRFHIDNIIC